MNPLKIILLEDSTFDVDLIERELKKAGIEFTCKVVDTREEFEIALCSSCPDVVLSDHSMPQFNSIEAFHLLKEYQSRSSIRIPFILVTGEVTEEFAAQCLRAGVSDYILKDRLKRLPLAIQSAIEKCRAETERLQYLEEVIRKEALMTEVGHLARLGSWQTDLVTGKHTWSDQSYCIYGYEKGAVEPGFETFFSIVHPDDVDMIKIALDQALSNLDSEMEAEFRIIDKNGNLKYIHGKLQIHRNSAGQAVRLVGFNLDITERKKFEIQLQKREEEYKSLFDQNPDLVFSWDVTGTLTNANRAVLQLTGQSLEALRAMPPRRLFADADEVRLDDYFHKALQGEPQRFRAAVNTSRGEPVRLEVTYIPIVTGGKVAGIHGVGRTISD